MKRLILLWKFACVDWNRDKSQNSDSGYSILLRLAFHESNLLIEFVSLLEQIKFIDLKCCSIFVRGNSWPFSIGYLIIS